MHKSRLAAIGLTVTIAANLAAGPAVMVKAADEKTGYTVEAVQDTKEGADAQKESDDSTAAGKETPQAPVASENQEQTVPDSDKEENATKPSTDDVQAKEEKEETKKPDATPSTEKVPEQTVKNNSIPVPEVNENAAEQAVVDKSELKSVLEDAERQIQNESYFTADSIAALKTKYRECKAVYDNPSATQQEVDDARAGLEMALSNLYFTVSGYKAYINDLIATAEGNMLGELMYTQSSWNAYKTAKQNLLQVRDNPQGFSAEERNAREQAYVNAYLNLAMRAEDVDKTDIKAAIRQAEYVVNNPTLFTNESVTRVQTALDSFDKTQVDSFDSQQTDAYLRNLTNALNQVELSDAGIREQIAEFYNEIAEKRSADLYSDAELNVLMLRLNTAENFMDFNSPAEAKAEISFVIDALNNLQMDADKTSAKLQAIVDNSEFEGIYNEIKGGSVKYDKGTADYFVQMYDEALALLAGPQAAANEYFELSVALTTAKGYLVLSIDAADTLIKDLEYILNVEKDTIGKPGGLTQSDYDFIQQKYEELKALRNADNIDLPAIVKLSKEINEFLVNMKRVPYPTPSEITPPTTDTKKPEATVTKTTANKTTQNKPTQKKVKSVKTGDSTDASALSLIASGLAVGAAILAKKKK